MVLNVSMYMWDYIKHNTTEHPKNKILFSSVPNLLHKKSVCMWMHVAKKF